MARIRFDVRRGKRKSCSTYRAEKWHNRLLPRTIAVYYIRRCGFCIELHYNCIALFGGAGAKSGQGKEPKSRHSTYKNICLLRRLAHCGFSNGSKLPFPLARSEFLKVGGGVY